MLILSYGFKLPQTPDKGSLWFPALEFDIQRMNDHNHDGNNSSKLPSSAVTTVKGSVLAASWVAVAGQAGTFRQQVTMPATMLFDDYLPSFRLTTGGHPIFPTLEKIDATHYWVYINDNTLDLTVAYLA